MQIFHHQEQGVLLTAAQVHLPQRGKGALFDDFRRELGQRPGGGRPPQELDEIRGAARLVTDRRPGAGGHLCGYGVWTAPWR